MNGKLLNSSSQWYTEPIKRIGTWVAWLAALITAILAIANQTGFLDLVPEKYRDRVTAYIVILGLILTALHKVQALFARNGVPGTKFNGMDSPATVHSAMLNPSAPVVAAVTAPTAPVTFTPPTDGTIPPGLQNVADVLGLAPSVPVGPANG